MVEEVMHFQGGLKTFTEVERIMYIENSTSLASEIGQFTQIILELQGNIDDLQLELDNTHDQVDSFSVDDAIDDALSDFDAMKRHVKDSEEETFTKDDVLKIIADLRNSTRDIKFSC